jgi:antitoxin ParD1/3/4
MSTVTMNISLTEDLKSFVDARIKARGYSSGSEYMRDLVRQDEERAKEERFKTLIQEGLESGPGRPWSEVKAEMQARIEAHRQQTAKSPANSRKAA